jgi:hypothetical protein
MSEEQESGTAAWARVQHKRPEFFWLQPLAQITEACNALRAEVEALRERVALLEQSVVRYEHVEMPRKCYLGAKSVPPEVAEEIAATVFCPSCRRPSSSKTSNYCGHCAERLRLDCFACAQPLQEKPSPNRPQKIVDNGYRYLFLVAARNTWDYYLRDLEGWHCLGWECFDCLECVVYQKAVADLTMADHEMLKHYGRPHQGFQWPSETPRVSNP